MIGQDTLQRGSVSRWIPGLRSGDGTAAQEIWERYKQQMLLIANRELRDSGRTVADEDDVVIVAFAAFLRRSSLGAYTSMSTRDDLWRLLATITRTHAWRQSRFLGRLRRGGVRRKQPTASAILSEIACGRPSPDVLVSFSETLKHLLDCLEDPALTEVALGRLQGMSNDEIAAKQNRSVRTIERRLNVIRSTWTEEMTS